MWLTVRSTGEPDKGSWSLSPAAPSSSAPSPSAPHADWSASSVLLSVCALPVCAFFCESAISLLEKADEAIHRAISASSLVWVRAGWLRSLRNCSRMWRRSCTVRSDKLSLDL